MSYHIKARDKTATKALRRIARSQIGKAIDEIDDDTLRIGETVHQVRKRCKKLRGLIRLVRPAFPDHDSENAAFRDAARTLAPIRDAFVMVDTLDGLLERFEGKIDRPAFTPLRDRLVGVIRDRTIDGRADDLLAGCRAQMVEARGRVDDWKVRQDGFEAYAGGLKKTYGRAVNALEKAEAEPSAENFHDFRKRVKYHRYHARLLREIWPGMMAQRRDFGDVLGEALGDHHDIAVLRRCLDDLPCEDGTVDESAHLIACLSAERQEELVERILPLGRRLFAEPPKALARRWGEYWGVWQDA